MEVRVLVKCQVPKTGWVLHGPATHRKVYSRVRSRSGSGLVEGFWITKAWGCDSVRVGVLSVHYHCVGIEVDVRLVLGLG